MHPWERDARMARKALDGRPQAYGLLIELACTKSSYELLGARKAYQSLYVRSKAIKLGITNNRHGDKKKLFKDEEIVRILATKSKPYLKAVFKGYKETFNKNIEEDLDETSLKETIYCLYAPPMCFSKILDSAMKANTNEDEKEALTRVIVTRANVDIKNIAEEYNKQYGTPLTKKIEDVALGNYKDFLVTLVQRAG
ncbi:annexin D4-like [Vitis riparia]|uniref:annexin D4-like n=1 Tax=Vitis riparia TaxID=96939 RepID=UPI00155AA2B0|nr:annexin D4-like [Vitis riparia]